MCSSAVDGFVVVDEDAVVDDGCAGGCLEYAVFEDGGVEDDVEALPLAWGSAGVYEGRGLAVDGGGLAVGVEECLV